MSLGRPQTPGLKALGVAVRSAHGEGNRRLGLPRGLGFAVAARWLMPRCRSKRLSKARPHPDLVATPLVRFAITFYRLFRGSIEAIVG